ncbi:hypothetical protein [Okeania sp.]|uniref:hypothetical protein n=1 Tax=Okeania sp. TaxID=3100323 RepID=UPI002B4AE0C9|nr:hypothetical protein [Okeania sp.]MEB3340860.1 hypothetical protein [Okeania sp.]
MNYKLDKLFELAKHRYRMTLTSVEQRLLKAIATGKVADYQVKSPELTLLKEQLNLELLKDHLKELKDVKTLKDLDLEKLKELENLEQPEALKKLLSAIIKKKEINNPAQAELWGEEQILPAKFIYWLCTDVDVFPYFTNHGLQICGAKISGELNLEFVKFKSLLYFTECVFTEKIILRGAKVEEVKFDGSHVVSIDAELIEVRGNLYLINGFHSKGEVNLAGAIIGGQLDCSNGHFFNPEGDALFAESIEVKDSIFLREGFQAKGMVSLAGATIGGTLDCSQGRFSNLKGDALFAESIEVKGSIFLREGFQAEGIVSLAGATIDGVLDCSQGHFSNLKGEALIAQSIEVKGGIFLSDGFKAEGEVSLSGASIGGVLDCTQGHFSNLKGKALIAQSIETKSSVILGNGFKAEGEVSLSGASIGGQLNCSEGHFSNPEGEALIAQSIETKSSVILGNGFNAEGEVSLSGASIGGQLNCSEGHFSNAGKDALFAENIKVKADVILGNGFNAGGKVSLFGSTIGGKLDCTQGHFSNPEKNALDAQNIEVKTNIVLSNGFKAEGEVDLTAANIKGNLDCTNGNFSNEKGNVLSAEGINVDGDIILDGGTFKGKIYLVSARVDDTLSMIKIQQEKLNIPINFFLINIKNNPFTSLLQEEHQRIESNSMKIDLQFARIGRLRDDEKSWPEKNNLNLDGFIYQKFGTDDNIKVLKDAKTRLKWLRLQPEFFPQTYEQLAEVLKQEGDPDAATEILINKERDIRPKLKKLSNFWNRFLDFTIVYGYKPTRALFLSSIFIFSGVYLFRVGYENCSNSISNNKCLFSPVSQVSPYSEETDNNQTINIDYPKFNSLLYSLDTFIPIIDLHQQTYWLPNSQKGKEIPLILFKVKTGDILRWYLWIHIICGWVLTSLWVAGFSGLVRR